MNKTPTKEELRVRAEERKLRDLRKAANDALRRAEPGFAHGSISSGAAGDGDGQIIRKPLED